MPEPELQRIDAHVHFWKLDRGDYTALTPDMPTLLRDHLPDDIAPELEAAGVDSVVVVQAAETVAESRFTLGLADSWPNIVAIVGWVDLADHQLAATLEEFATDCRYKGVRPVRDDNRSMAWLNDHKNDRAYAVLAERDLSVDMLVQDPDELPEVSAIAARHPDLTIILDHCGKPDVANDRFQPWSNAIATLAEHENVVCKLSGLLNCAGPNAGPNDLRGYSDHVLSCFGASRVMWASDWPPLTLASSYSRWCVISDALIDHLSDAERAEILSGTARRTYRL